MFVASIVAAVALQLSGRGFLGFDHQSAPMMETLYFTFHWSLFPVGTAAVIGLLCLFLPPHGQRHDEKSTT